MAATKGGQHQHEELEDQYTVWFYDGQEVHFCTIWRGEVPHGVVACGYSQEQNDTDKAEWEAAYKPSSNTRLAPRTSDGKTIVMPSFFPGGVFFYVTGAGDDCTPGALVRGAGTAFNIASEAAETQNVEFQFCDWVYLSGGGIMCDGAVIGDYISMKLYAPSSAGALSAGGGTGNANLVSGVIVPAAGNGAYNVDLTAVTPVPAYNEDTGLSSGYWDWSEPDTGKGTVTASAVPGTGKWHLIAANVDLVRFVNRMQLASSMDIVIETNIKPKKILPHWKFKVTAVNGGHTGLRVAWYLRSGRIKTV